MVKMGKEMVGSKAPWKAQKMLKMLCSSYVVRRTTLHFTLVLQTQKRSSQERMA